MTLTRSTFFGLLTQTMLTTVLAVPPAHSQANGRIALFSDSLHTDSTLTDSSPGVFTVYACHVDMQSPGAAGVHFRVVQSPGFTATWMAEAPRFPFFIGTTVSGITMLFEACLETPMLLVEINYFGSGTSETCSHLDAAPHPDDPTGDFAVIRCDASLRGPPTFGKLLVNCGTVPAEETTWGRIKEIYRY